MRKLLLTLALPLLLALLTGCAGPRLLQADVQALSTLPAGSATLKGARYRFERLPSQAQQPQFPQLEQLAQEALTQVGLVHDEGAAQYSVLLGARVNTYLVDNRGSPMNGSWWPGAWPGQGGIVIGTGGAAVGFGLNFPPSRAYTREVSLLMRDLRSGQVVYETRAVSDSPWHDTDRLLAALFEAALTNFPEPPAGIRQVNIEIPH